MKKLFAILTVLLLLGTVLSACQIGAPQYECEDEFGCVQVCGDDPVRIAFSFVISGPDASLGTDTQRGVEMAAEEHGELMGHSIEVVGEAHEVEGNSDTETFRAVQHIVDTSGPGPACGTHIRAEPEEPDGMAFPQHCAISRRGFRPPRGR